MLELARAGTDVLARRGDGDHRLESEILLAHVLGLDRMGLYLRYDMPVDVEPRGRFRALVRRRLAHEPVAYLTGERGFLDGVFEVTPDVLIPRPETEQCVEVAVESLSSAPTASPYVVDFGTGSGCILVSILGRVVAARGIGVDLSRAALRVARRNARRHDVEERCRWLRADMHSALVASSRWIDIVVSNPPYIGEEERASLAPDVVDNEPALALFSPDEPLHHHRRILATARASLRDGGACVFELPGSGGDALSQEARTLGYVDVEVLHDLDGHERVFRARI